MCGIAGIIDHSALIIPTLEKMSTVLRHRGPDDEGYLLVDRDFKHFVARGNETIRELSDNLHISNHVKGHYIAALLHRRLAIIDLTPRGHQPMSGHENDVFIVFNGEIYNYRELKDELKDNGYIFRGDSDTEVIIASYLKWGPECVLKFIGMWAFAILDLKNKLLFLSRDRFGIKPLYYTLIGEKFAFASEIKALVLTGQAKPNINNYKLGEFLLFGNTFDPSGNLFKQIHTLPEGHNLIAPLNKPSDYRILNYYNLKKEVGEINLSSDSLTERFHHMFNESVDLHLRSDVPVGVNLSGGLDSSSITAFMARKMKNKTFKTFTAAYYENEIDESKFAKKVINHFSNIEPYFTYPSISEFWNDLDTQVWHHDLPFHSTSMYAQWSVMKLANLNGIKVLLNGQGSDEMLGGYFPFTGLFLLGLLNKCRFYTLVNEYKALKKNYNKSINNAIFRALYGWLPGNLKQFSRKTFRIGNSFLNESYIKELGIIQPPQFHARSFGEMSILSIKHGLQQLLRYEDRLSMAFSIESRVPFLDHRLVEFAVALDPAWKIHNGWTKYILRKSSEPYLPYDIIWRKDKMGFLTPAGKWKKELEKELLEYVTCTSHLPFLNRAEIVKACRSNNDEPSHISEFWKIIVTLKWAEIFKVS